MAENKNMELKDEMLNSAVGGETIVYEIVSRPSGRRSGPGSVEACPCNLGRVPGKQPRGAMDGAGGVRYRYVGETRP